MAQERRAQARRASHPSAWPQKKRIGGRIKEEKEEQRKAREAAMAGVKSAAAEARAIKAAKRAGKGERSEFSKSAAVFARIQETREMEKAGVKVRGREGDETRLSGRLPSGMEWHLRVPLGQARQCMRERECSWGLFGWRGGVKE